MFWKTKDNTKDEKIDYRQKIVDLKEQFHEELDTLRLVAQSDIPSWHDYLKTIAVTPIGDIQRDEAKAKGIDIPKVAFPSEYRAALVIFKKKIRDIVVALKSKILAVEDDIAENDLEDFTDKYLKKLVKKELKRYIEKNKPNVSVANIFANASTSINKFSPKEVGDKSYSIKCKTCGAVRLEEDQYDDCFYCGTPLFKK